MMNAIEDLPRTIGGAREAHLRLMREWRDMEKETLLARVRQLRLQLQETGERLGDLADRDEVQGMLDYWASAIAAVPGEQFPERIWLAPYQAEPNVSAANDAERLYGALGSAEEQRIARSIFEDLFQLRDGELVRASAKTRETLRQRVGGRRFDHVLEKYVEAGVIAKIAADDSADDRFEIADAGLCADWKRLREWLDALNDYGRRRDQLIAKAETWRQMDESSRYLATSADLIEMDRFRGESELLDRYIVASQRSAKRRGWAAQLLVAALLLTMGALGFQAWVIGRQSVKIDELDQLDKQIAPSPQATVASGDALAPRLDGAIGRIDMPALSGAMWLGTEADPQVFSPLANAPAAAFAQARSGALYRAKRNIYLREDTPADADEYRSRPVKGVVPAGALVELIQAPETYDRPSGRQYWAKVRMIPRVYIQHDGMAEPDLEELRRSLARLGFDVPQPELTPDAAGKNELRFFGADGKTLAIRLLDSVEAGRVAGLPALACHDFSDYMKDRKKYDIPLGQIELWIGRDVVTKGRTPSVGCT